MNMPLNPQHFNDLVTPALRTTSKIIADRFEKQHAHVMRDIRSLIDTNPEWGVSNFGETPYVDPQNGQTYKMFDMTRDGYTMLVMGFTGKKAMEWKIRFLEAFNAMEAKLRRPLAIDVRDPSQLAQIAVQLIEVNQDQAKQIEAMKDDVDALDRLSKADGSLCITDAAKALQIRRSDLFTWLRENGWIYRRAGSGHDLGYQSKTTAGLLEHKVTTVLRADGSEKVTEQVRVTPRGLAKLAKAIGGAA